MIDLNQDLGLYGLLQVMLVKGRLLRLGLRTQGVNSLVLALRGGDHLILSD